jgi:hypothetical protein
LNLKFFFGIRFPEKLPQRHKDTKKNCLLKFIFVFWCIGGENVLSPNVVDPSGGQK